MKPERLQDLAVFSGMPAFAEPLYVGRPNIGDTERFLERVRKALDRRWLTNDGPLLNAFEQRLADRLDVKHALAICNGTVAEEILLRASDCTGEVILPAFTFIATVHAVKWLGLEPVFCDIDPRTHNIDPGMVEALITPRTSAILGVHAWGRPCDTNALAAIAERHNLRLFFDAAHAFGCTHQGRPIGNFGDAEFFSFHATKYFNTFEGGAISTNCDALADRIRLMRTFGFSDYDQVDLLGINGKMNEVSAAMGLTGLETLDVFLDVNLANYRAYQTELELIPGVSLVTYGGQETHNYQYVAAEVDAAGAGLNRDELVRVLHAENVLARRYFFPGCHRMQPYATTHAGLSLPHTERLADRILCLPTGTAVDAKDIAKIRAILSLAVDHAPEVRRQLLDHPEPGPEAG